MPSAVAIKAAGYSFTCRYLTDGGPGLPGKLLKPGEFADLMAYGISVALNWETTADRMLDGYNAGVADANQAASVAASLGVPDDRPIYFSCDMDASLAQQAEVDDYLRGCASVIGLDRVGIYGGFWPVSRALNNGTATWAWQTEAWSGGNIEPRAHLLQRIGFVTVDGVECDVNEALVLPDFGQHPVPATSRSRRRDPSMELPPTASRIDKQVPTDVVNGWCGAANLWLTANTDGATVYGVYQVVNRGSDTPPQVTPLLTSPNGKSFTQWWPAMYALEPGTTSVIINYTAPQGMQAHVEYQH